MSSVFDPTPTPTPAAAPEPDPLAALVARAQALVGVDLGFIADGLGLGVPPGQVRTKGWSGRILEMELGAAAGGGRGQDFEELGIELKTVPVDAAGRPLESTCVCHINPNDVVRESWETSYLRRKLSRVLFVALEVPRGATSVGDRRVAAAGLWRPRPEEEALLAADFDLLVRDYFRPGRYGELRATIGRVLQVRPKGRNAADRQAVRSADGQITRIGRCGFYLRPRFVGEVLGRL